MNKNAVELDHISVPVRRYREARALYEAALGAIGMTVNLDVGDACGMGANGEKILWLVRNRSASGGEHTALRVAKRSSWTRFTPPPSPPERSTTARPDRAPTTVPTTTRRS